MSPLCPVLRRDGFEARQTGLPALCPPCPSFLGGGRKLLSKTHRGVCRAGLRPLTSEKLGIEGDRTGQEGQLPALVPRSRVRRASTGTRGVSLLPAAVRPSCPHGRGIAFTLPEPLGSPRSARGKRSGAGRGQGITVPDGAMRALRYIFRPLPLLGTRSYRRGIPLPVRLP